MLATNLDLHRNKYIVLDRKEEHYDSGMIVLCTIIGNQYFKMT